jgi:uncharacterized DUF497 family protein
MIFHWDDQNRAHISRHDVAPSQAEDAFKTDGALFFQDATRLNRWVVEAAVDGRTLKVAFARVFPDGYRVITAHWIHSRRRRK